MSVWKGGLWASQRYPNGGGPWKGGLWRSQRLISATQRLINTLFGNGEQGVFYVPQPVVDGKQVLFQDSTGTIPVTSDSDPVGLMLDISQGLKLGPELVTNGTFNSDTDWTKEAVWSISGGVATADGSTTGNIYQSGILTPGATYEVSVDVTFDPSGGDTAITIRDTPSGSNLVSVLRDRDGSGTHTFVLKVSNSDFVVRAGLLHRFFRGTIGNISIRELKGNHATQPTSAARPVYRTDGTLHWLEGDGVDDVLVVPRSKTKLSFLTNGTGATLQLVFKKAWRANKADALAGTAFYSAIPNGLDLFVDNRSAAINRYRHVNPTDSANNTSLLDNAAASDQPTIFEYQQDASGQTWSTSEGVSASANLVTEPTDNELCIFGVPDSTSETTSHLISPGTLKFHGGVIVSEKLSDLSNTRNYLAKLAGITL